MDSDYVRSLEADRLMATHLMGSLVNSRLNRQLSARFSVALGIFVLTLLALWPQITTLPQQPDEAQYGWSAAYFGARAAHLDWSEHGSDGPTSDADRDVDPGWSPSSWWSRTQPMGARLVYAIPIAALHLSTPPLPFAYTVATQRGAGQLLDADTLRALRTTAVLSAAIGLALLTWRIGPRPAIGLVLFLAVPQVRDDLTYAWAEGPLVLAFGLCALTYRTHWFGVTLGVAAAAKLTGLIVWPLLLLPLPISHARWARVVQVASALATWTLLTPPAWFSGGPLYLVTMILNRLDEHAAQAQMFGAGWMLVPTHYVLPLELALSLLIGVVLAQAARLLQHTHWVPRLQRAMARCRSSLTGSTSKKILPHLRGSVAWLMGSGLRAG